MIGESTCLPLLYSFFVVSIVNNGRFRASKTWGGLSSQTQKNAGVKMRPLLELSPRRLLKSGLGPLARCCTHQKTISGAPEQAYLPSDPRLEVIIEVRPGALGTHQETISGRPEQKYLPSDQGLE